MSRLTGHRRVVPLGRRLLGWASVSLLAVAVASAEPPTLRLPADCTLGSECVIQNYVDHDGRSGQARDYRCGHLTYDGHTGTDIRVPTTAEMATGVEVTAAARGRVIAVRDGMPDAFPDDLGPEVVADRQAGNSVIIQHGDDWQTQYSHLRLGSVAVRPGQTVQTGTVLGEIGLSGVTEFPHVEFSVRHQGATVDPFTGASPQERCQQAATEGNGLWSAKATERLGHERGPLLAAGFSARPPEQRGVKSGAVKAAPPRVDAEALVFWGLFYGLREGDRLSLQLRGPDRRLIAEQEQRFEQPMAEWIGYVGKRRDRKWPAGVYRAVIRIDRAKGDGAPSVHRREVTLGSE